MLVLSSSIGYFIYQYQMKLYHIAAIAGSVVVVWYVSANYDLLKKMAAK